MLLGQRRSVGRLGAGTPSQTLCILAVIAVQAAKLAFRLGIVQRCCSTRQRRAMIEIASQAHGKADLVSLRPSQNEEVHRGIEKPDPGTAAHRHS